jgi:hypothetical protein
MLEDRTRMIQAAKRAFQGLTQDHSPDKSDLNHAGTARFSKVF